MWTLKAELLPTTVEVPEKMMDISIAYYENAIFCLGIWTGDPTQQIG